LWRDYRNSDLGPASDDSGGERAHHPEFGYRDRCSPLSLLMRMAAHAHDRLASPCGWLRSAVLGHGVIVW
jgi:hypothetical protein